MKRILISGGGLVGCVLSIFLSRRGHSVTVCERAADTRKTKNYTGRSINLTLCDRGLAALDELGVGEKVRAISVPVFGRVIHSMMQDLDYQPYGNQREAIYSISRSELNKTLLDYAESSHDIDFHFGEKFMGMDFDSSTIQLELQPTGEALTRKADLVFGADGAYSGVRNHLLKKVRLDYCQQYWSQGYKELTIPSAKAAQAGLEKNALHIWPRGRYMLICFPNSDGSFTCALHMAYEGKPSFEAIRTKEDLQALFEESFPDAIPLMPDLVADYFSNPTNSMVTIRCSPWSCADRVALIGDAAHAILPSYGQGANAGFEDCLVLNQCLERHAEDFGPALREYTNLRKPNMDVMADLCIEHFKELTDLVGVPEFLLRKEIERHVNRLYPDKYLPLYSVITFTRTPYAEAHQRDKKQRRMIDQIMSIEAIADRLDSPDVEKEIARLINDF